MNKQLVYLLIANIIFVLLVHQISEDMSMHIPIVLNLVNGEYSNDYFVSNWPPNEPPVFVFMTWIFLKLFGFAGISIVLPLILQISWVSAIYLLIRELSNEKIALYSASMLSFMSVGYHMMFNSILYLPRTFSWTIAPLIFYMLLKGFTNKKHFIGAAALLSLAIVSHPTTAVGIAMVTAAIVFSRYGIKGIKLLPVLLLPMIIFSLPYFIEYNAWSSSNPKTPLDSEILLTRTPYIFPPILNIEKISFVVLNLISSPSGSSLLNLFREINENILFPFILFIPIIILNYKNLKNKLMILWIGFVIFASALTFTGIDFFARLLVFRNLRFLLIPLILLYWQSYFSVKDRRKKILLLVYAILIVLSTVSYQVHIKTAAENLGLVDSIDYCNLEIPKGALILAHPSLQQLRLCGWSLVVSREEGNGAIYSLDYGERWQQLYKNVKETFELGDRAALLRLANEHGAEYIVTKDLEVIEV